MIAILSPHLHDIYGDKSPNLGDEIIYTYINLEIAKVFPNEEVYAFPLHSHLNKYHRAILERSRLILVAGSNMVVPNLRQQRLALLSLKEFGIRRKLVFLGVGWSSGVEIGMESSALHFYDELLATNFPQSVRDSLTHMKLSGINRHWVNTSCPTMWKLESRAYNLRSDERICLLTLTDYAIDFDKDEGMLGILIDRFDELYFFPQGKFDANYLASTGVFKRNRSRFKILDRSLSELNAFLASASVNYVGTRLHCGIHCLNHGKDSLIISVDNRARAIFEDTRLPVAARSNHDLIKSWLAKGTVFSEFRLPHGWDAWKLGFGD